MTMRSQWSNALLLAVTLALLGGGCRTGGLTAVMHPEVSGTATLHGKALGDREFAPVSCRSGEYEFFYGADFGDADGTIARFILDPSGAARLRLFDAGRPEEPGVVFTASDCSELAVSLGRTGWEVNEIHDLHADVAFTCRSGSGETASGHLSAQHCH
ncbi:MAG: hypothetical protein WBX15_08535 [Thermoanaerobaculia bacterium]